MLFAHRVATNKIDLLTLAQSGLATGLLCLSYALGMVSPALVFFVSFCFIYLQVL